MKFFWISKSLRLVCDTQGNSFLFSEYLMTLKFNEIQFLFCNFCCVHSMSYFKMKFIEVQFIYNKLHTVKVYNSLGLTNIYTLYSFSTIKTQNISVAPQISSCSFAVILSLYSWSHWSLVPVDFFSYFRILYTWNHVIASPLHCTPLKDHNSAMLIFGIVTHKAKLTRMTCYS